MSQLDNAPSFTVRGNFLLHMAERLPMSNCAFEQLQILSKFYLFTSSSADSCGKLAEKIMVIIFLRFLISIIHPLKFYSFVIIF